MKFQQISRLILLFTFLAGFVTAPFAKEIPKKPEPFMLVVDHAGVLSANEAQVLEAKLRMFDDSTSTQICIVIDQSLEGEDVFDYSQRLAQAWGVGQKGSNNGLLIYLAISDHKTYIQVGYGLEGIIPDATAKQIIEDYMLPEFRKNNYYQGLNSATTLLIGLANKEFPASKLPKRPHAFNAKNNIKLIGILLILLFVFITRIGGRRRRMGLGWGAFMAGTGAFGGFGGSSGGSFGGGGFGGGSFGGGGAGGSW